MGDTGERAKGRGVLDGAFRVLDVLASRPGGAGLSEIARACGVPKASCYRLLDQLVELGAAQRDGQRYFVGSTLARLGQAWQPSPRLRDAALDPVRTLAALTRTAVAVTVLSGDRVRVVIATRGALGELPKITVGSDLARRTAAGQVLLAADENRDPPEEFSRAEWRRLRAGMRHSAIALDHQEVTPGVCCVATPVALPGGRGIASLSALSVGRALPRHVPDLVLRAAGEISRNLVVR